MSIRASSLVGRDVFASDDKKIGEVVNILINVSNGQADLVVFPRTFMKLIQDHSGTIAGSVAGQAASSLKHFIPGAELVDMAVDEVGGYFSGRAGGKVKQVMTAVQESFYLLPLAFAREITPESIFIDITRDDCRKWFLNAAPAPEMHMTFYGESHYHGPARAVSSTLNTPSLEWMILKDGSGIEATIADLAIEFSRAKAVESGKVLGFIIEDPRVGANSKQIDRLVEFARLSRRQNQFVASKSFSDCVAV